MDGIEDAFRWNWSAEATPLSDQQVRRLWIAAETDEERVLVIGYCVWGVRTKELPGIRVSQFDFNPNDPKIVFGERARKNGQGAVTLMFGLDALANLLDKRDEQPNWNGHLYPSDHKERRFLCARQMRKRFKKLCRKAGITIDGEVPTPKHGRSFYYNILADAETDLLEMAGELVKEQGASDPKSVREYYLTPERRRWYRHVFFRHRIQQILPEDAYTRYSNSTNFDGSIDDFN
jgi:integrase